MTAYLMRRAIHALLTFLGITVATFALIHAVPGDPIAFYLGRAGAQTVPRETLESIRREFRLDRPLPVQYVYWLRAAATLDFGSSVLHRRPVSEVMFEKLPNTFVLNLAAFLLAVGLGVPVGLWSAIRAGQKRETVVSVLLFLLFSLPTFWVALVLIQLFSVRLDVLPLFGMVSDEYRELGLAARLGDRLQHMALPVLVVAYGQIAIFARFTRSAAADVIGQDFIVAGRARGVAPAGLLWRHVLRNALMPLITLLGLAIPLLISGSVIVEKIFQWDGIGLLYIDAVSARDYPLIMGLSVATAVLTLLASLVADVLYAAADPRVRLEERR